MRPVEPVTPVVAHPFAASISAVVVMFMLCGLIVLAVPSCSSGGGGNAGSTVANSNASQPDRNTAVGRTVSNADAAFTNADESGAGHRPVINRAPTPTPGTNAGQPTVTTNTNPPSTAGPLSPKPERKLTYEDARRNWLDERVDPRYPRGNFLLGFGSGTRSDEADARARAEIAAYFKTSIKSQADGFSAQIMAARNGAPPSVYEFMQFRSSIDAIVEGSLEGSEIVDSYTSPDRRTYLSLAVMDRVVFAENLKVKIEALKNQIKAAVDAATRFRTKGAWLNALQSYIPCVDLFNKLAALVVEYNLGKPSSWPTMGLDIDLSDILKGLAECAWQLTLVFRLEVNYTYKDGRSETASSTAIEEYIVNAFAEKRVGVTVVRTNSRFHQIPLDTLKGMTGAELAKALAFGDSENREVNYLVVGKLDTRYIKDEVIPNQAGVAQRFRATYDLNVIELKSDTAWSVGDQVGRAQAAKSDAKTACADAVRVAARFIAESLIHKFTSTN